MNAAIQPTRRRPAAAAVIAAAVIAAAHCPVAPAAAAQPLRLGTADPGYVGGDAGRREALFDETVAAGADVVRFNATWYRIAPTEPLPLSDPADPRNLAYDFAELDEAVEEADARGLDVILTLQRAPSWAEGDNPPAARVRGVWKPDPVAFGDFAQAVATRYSGSFRPTLLGAPLPRVRWYQAWNEANLHNHYLPQHEGGEPVSVESYRTLLNRAYDGIKAADPTAIVVAAGTAPLESRSGVSVGPETFWRELLCLKASLVPEPSCPRARFDVFDHHPITRRDPAEPGPRDSVLIADYPDLTRLLRTAERAGTVAPAGTPRPLWATEIYWETNPPDPSGLPPAKAAGYLQRGIRMLHERGVSLQLNFFMADLRVTPGHDHRPGGLLFNDLSRKPSFTAFRFPFVTERLSRRRVSAWGRSPLDGKLRIERKVKHRWKAVEKLRVRAGTVFKTKLKLKGRASLRARVGRDSSLVFKQR